MSENTETQRGGTFAADQVTTALLERYDQPGPRYTSYPTAVEFHEGFDAREY